MQTQNYLVDHLLIAWMQLQFIFSRLDFDLTPVHFSVVHLFVDLIFSFFFFFNFLLDYQEVKRSFMHVQCTLFICTLSASYECIYCFVVVFLTKTTYELTTHTNGSHRNVVENKNNLKICLHCSVDYQSKLCYYV